MPAPKDPIKKQQWLDNMSAEKKKRWSNPEYKARLVKGMKQRAKDNPEHYKRMASLVAKGSASPQWNGDSVGYFGIHKWLLKIYGKANHCENLSCPKKSKRFEWAKVKGKEYKRRRTHFKQLCSGCHKSYDNIGDNLWKNRVKQ